MIMYLPSAHTPCEATFILTWKTSLLLETHKQITAPTSGRMLQPLLIETGNYSFKNS